jgi:SAM-dependent methyltransferase
LDRSDAASSCLITTFTAIDMLKKIIRRLTRGARKPQFYSGRNYLDAYRAHTDYRVEKDPADAIGGLWNELGRLQFSFLQRRGLKPHHQLLDYGCGTLRGGRLFIPYLDAGNYLGVDISVKAIERAREVIEEEQLTTKAPELIWNKEASLDFSEIGEKTFDFVIAQSVFTHLLPEHIETCISHIPRILKSDGRFFFTNFDAHEFTKKSEKDFAHPTSFYYRLADRNNLDLRDLRSAYHHPRGQSMYMLTLRQN